MIKMFVSITVGKNKTNGKYVAYCDTNYNLLDIWLLNSNDTLCYLKKIVNKYFEANKFRIQLHCTNLHTNLV